jgi:transposase
MDKTSKVILGLTQEKDRGLIKCPNRYFTDLEKHQIIREYLEMKATKQEIWEKYTGQKEEHGQLLYWMRKLGYDVGISVKSPNFAYMAKKKAAQTPAEESFETLQLKKRIAELEEELKDAQMKAIAFSTMVDIAEKEFKIPIRKKFNTKP